MRGVVLIVLPAALWGCDAPSPANGTQEPKGVVTSEFPKAGNYHIIVDRSGGETVNRDEWNSAVDASSREKLEQLVEGFETASCHDRKADVDDGSFEISKTCDGPVGETKHSAHGTYSRDSIDITRETSASNGETASQTITYRLQS
jgi:hypothetical protein